MLDRPILVPLDGSELSEKAIPYAVSIARAANQPIVLLTVWEGVEAEPWPAPVTTTEDTDESARSLRQGYLDDAARRVAAHGMEVEKVLRDGCPSEEILFFCYEHAPGLLVMATHGRSGIQRMLYGSVASKLMHAASVPTLLVGPKALEDAGAPPAIRNILVPLGGSPLGEFALEPAAALAEALEAGLILVRAVRLPPQTFAFDVSSAYLPGIEQAVTAAAEQYLLRVRERIRTERPVQRRVLRGFPAAAIAEFVAEEHIDLVVMASHVHSGVARWALGSLAQRVIQGPAPVLFIRPQVAATLTRSEEVRGRYCHSCGRAAAYMEIGQDDRCLRCGQHLHICANCVYFHRLACLLQRSEAHGTYPGLTCIKFQFVETVQAKGQVAIGTKR